MTNLSGKAVTWGIWEVAQADDPEETAFAASPKARFPDGYRAFPDNSPAEGQVTVKDAIVRIRRRPDHNSKIGGWSPKGWIESRWGALRFRIAADLPKTGTYPDDGCGQEIYTSDDPNRYVEMELLAPICTIGPGENTRVVTRWSLARTR
jgi:hypothetical protein